MCTPADVLLGNNIRLIEFCFQSHLVYACRQIEYTTFWCKFFSILERKSKKKKTTIFWFRGFQLMVEWWKSMGHFLLNAVYYRSLDNFWIGFFFPSDNYGQYRVEHRLYSIVKTIVCFVIFLLCIQPLLLSYAFVSIVRWIWRSILIMKNPHLEFVKTENLRSVSYTARNPGIVNIILHMQNEPNISVIREAIAKSVLQRTNKFGTLAFPKLTAKLVSCWGHYAWNTNKCVAFDFDWWIIIIESGSTNFLFDI